MNGGVEQRLPQPSYCPGEVMTSFRFMLLWGAPLPGSAPWRQPRGEIPMGFVARTVTELASYLPGSGIR